MAYLTGVSTLSYNDLYGTGDSTAGSKYMVGQLGVSEGGAMFRYSLVGASNLVRGNVLQSKAQDTQFEAMAVPAAVAIQTAGLPQTATITNGTTTIAKDDFANGSLVIDTTPDGGSKYTVLGNTADSVGSAAVTLTLDRPLQTAWTTSTKVTLKWNPWFGVIQFPASTQTSMAAGVAISNLTAAYYGWVQTHGIASVLSDGQTAAVGSMVGTPSATAGSSTVFAAGSTHTQIGTILQAQSLGHWITVFLQID